MQHAIGTVERYDVSDGDGARQWELKDPLRQQATHDPLTGLANSRQLAGVLNSEINRFARSEREFALLILRMNGLKQINDYDGHCAGNNALCRLADALCSSSRDVDTPARFGGDEFALLLPETRTDGAHIVARRVCNRVVNDARTPRISIRVGVAVYPHDGDAIESLLHRTNGALHEIKGAENILYTSGVGV